MQLMPHQVEGVEWLAKQGHAALLDDPGLGKTIIAAVAAERAGHRRILVLAPACVLFNWKHEIEAWTGLRARVITKSKHFAVSEGDEVVVMSHGLFWRDTVYRRLIASDWDRVIVDESHFFRGRGAKRSVALYQRSLAFVTGGLWLLTGTPAPNDASELWTMVSGLGYTNLGFHAFRSQYCVTAWSPYGDNVKVIANKNAAELRGILKQFSLRRRKDILDLPAVRFEQVHLRPDTLPDKIKLLSDELGAELEAITAGAGTALEAWEQLGAAKAFASFRRLCGLAKAQATADLLEHELKDNQIHKVVVMAHHGDVVAHIAAQLCKFGVRTITGATLPKDRTAAVEAFQTNANVRVIVCNILAGGTGTTLTAAHELVFAEMSFVPGENAQAADRIRRIGQDKPCRVRFVALAGTLDEALVGVLRRKSEMIREIV